MSTMVYNFITFKTYFGIMKLFPIKVVDMFTVCLKKPSYKVYFENPNQK